MASGAAASIRRAISRRFGNATRSPGYVGTPSEANPSGVRNCTSAPSAAALRASEVSVRTTPFTCGCQASVAINIRMNGSLSAVDSQLPTFGHRYFRRVTYWTQVCDVMERADSLVRADGQVWCPHDTVVKHFITVTKPFCGFGAKILKPPPGTDRPQRGAEPAPGRVNRFKDRGITNAQSGCIQAEFPPGRRLRRAGNRGHWVFLRIFRFRRGCAAGAVSLPHDPAGAIGATGACRSLRGWRHRGRNAGAAAAP